MTIFLDTVGLLAVWDESDQWHRAAQACFSELLAGRADLVTSISKAFTSDRHFRSAGFEALF